MRTRQGGDESRDGTDDAGVTSSVDTPRPTSKDDDPFLLKFLPGSSPAMAELRAQVHRLNTNLGLAGFVLLIGETGTGKNHVARVMAGHRQWLAIRDNPGALDPGRGLPDGIAPLSDYTKRLGEVVLSVVTETLA